jgi:predicted methyltransferase
MAWFYHSGHPYLGNLHLNYIFTNAKNDETELNEVFVGDVDTSNIKFVMNNMPPEPILNDIDELVGKFDDIVIHSPNENDSNL